MRVIEIQNNSLLLSERPIPPVRAGEVLIKVEAAGLNRADLFQVQGKYPPPKGASDIPGLEVAGEIVAVADGVEGWRTGDRVAALLSGGGYAEYAVADAAQLLPLPSGFSAIEAASLPEACFTVWLNMVEKAALRAGESVLVHAGASGIGTLAIQYAKVVGAQVFATARSSRKCDACTWLGAEKVINTTEQDFGAVLLELTGGEGVNVILDVIGGEYIEQNLQCLAFGGRMISLAFLQGAKAQVNVAPLLLKNLTWMGSTLRAQPVAQKAYLAEQIRTYLWPLFEEGTLRPMVDSVFPFEEALAAHRYMAENRNIGKILLRL